MRTLNVYAIKAHGIYGGGMAIVAAVDGEQAKRLAAGLDRQRSTKFDAPEAIDSLPVSYEGEPRVVTWFATGE